MLPWLSKHYSAVHELELACSGSLCPLSAEPLVTAALLTAAGNQSVLSLQRLSIRNCCNPHLLPIICQLPSLTSLELEGAFTAMQASLRIGSSLFGMLQTLLLAGVAFPGQEGGLMGLCQLTKLTHLSICSATHSSPCFSHVITEQFWDSLPQQLQQLSLVDVKFHQSQRKYAPHKLTRLTELRCGALMTDAACRNSDTACLKASNTTCPWELVQCRRLEMVDCCYMGLPDSLYQMQHLEALTLSALDKAACLGTLASLTELAIRCVPNDLGACLLRQSKLKSLAITDLGSDRASKVSLHAAAALLHA